MREVKYTFTKENGLEYPARFKGQAVTYQLPETLDEFRSARIAPDANADDVIMGAINGQGLSLTIQKSLKDKAASIADDVPLEDAVATLTDHAANFRLGAPRAKGEGTGRKNGKVAAAEAKADAAVTAALDLYRTMPRNLRSKVRDQLLASNVVTAEELDAVDAE